MKECNHCGSKIEEHHKYCPLCGKNQEAKIKKGISYKTLFLILGAIGVLIVLFFMFGNGGEITGNVIGIDAQGNSGASQKVLEKESCPYECCSGGDYKEKSCSIDFECTKNKCVAIDTDGDGLTDIEEKEIGTNLRLVDTDGDTLNDYREVKILGTDPLDTNTDKDRYDDNLDPSPLQTNSANIKVSLIKNEGYWNEALKAKLIPVLGCLAIYAGEASLGEVTGVVAQLCAYVLGGVSLNALATEDISYRDIEVQIQNVGDDYTSSVSYRMDVYVKYGDKPKELFNSKEVNLGKLEPGKQLIDKSSYSFKVEDYTIGVLDNILDGKTGDREYLIEFNNINFEKF